jgi:hypothetical protein
MGGTLDYRIYEGDRKTITEQFEADCGQAKIEDGISYPGTIADFYTIRFWKDKQFNSEREAVDYLGEHHNKGEQAMAVSFRLPAKRDEKEIEKIEGLRASITSWHKRVFKAKQKAIKNFKARKSSTLGCSHCGSRMSQTHFNEKIQSYEIPCLVCGGSMLPNTDRVRINKLLDRVTLAQQKLNEAEKTVPNGKVAWVVGGVCSS